MALISMPSPEEPKLKRRLEARHLEMIAIGGAIGTGLLLRSGTAISSSGPVGALLCFAIVGLQVFGVSAGIGEMATLLPIDGGFSQFPSRFVHPSLGFATGWMYFITWVLTIAAEMAGVAGLMSFWVSTSTIQPWIWSLAYLAPLAFLNLFPVKGFAEVEFVLCILKIASIVVFLVIGLVVWFGANDTHRPLWFTNWAPAMKGDNSVDLFLRIAKNFTTAFFAYGGTELVGLTAGEAVNPRKSVPRAINGTFIRILIFYLGSLLVVGLILPPDSTFLLAPDVTKSPFVYAFKSVGILPAADIMNAIIIVAAVSAANSSIYACARTLMRLADEGSAHRIFSKVTKGGVPINAVILCIFVSLGSIGIAYSAGPNGSVHVFNWLAGFISYGVMIAWMVMSFTHIRFRNGYLAQGRKVEELPYIAPYFPYVDYISLYIGTVVTICWVFSSLYTNGKPRDEFFNLPWLMANSWLYCGVPLSFGLLFGHGLIYHRKAIGEANVWWALVRYDEMDFDTGRVKETEAELEEIELTHKRPHGMKEWGRRVLYKLF
ncbi:amino acid permease-domain-containing protein [Obelidium mucronatum]|nr:amino acid permease-domain-containing protein [Obelidium mucronatum]